jgi:hypothetical protein
MTWEWIAPATATVTGGLGMFFTWLTGNQSRKQALTIMKHNIAKEQRERLADERRKAYAAALSAAQVDLRRVRHEIGGDNESLAELEKSWPRSKQAQMRLEARMQVELCGTGQAAIRLDEWSDAYDRKDLGRMRELYSTFLTLMRTELGVVAIPDPSGGIHDRVRPLAVDDDTAD